MIDLFGLGRPAEGEPKPDSTVELEEVVAEDSPEGYGSHRFWLALLLLDFVFVVVFAGLVASKIYQYWRPADTLATPHTPHHAAPVKPVPAKPVVAPVPTPAPPPEETKKPVEKPAPARPATPPPAPPPALPVRAEGMRPPKPALVTEPPKWRATPALADSTDSTEAHKAEPFIFKYRGPNASSVQLVGAFIVHGGRKEMSRASDGTWTVRLYLNPGQYRYFFAVDKKKTLDPDNPHTDRGASVLVIP